MQDVNQLGWIYCFSSSYFTLNKIGGGRRCGLSFNVYDGCVRARNGDMPGNGSLKKFGYITIRYICFYNLNISPSFKLPAWVSLTIQFYQQISLRLYVIFNKYKGTFKNICHRKQLYKCVIGQNFTSCLVLVWFKIH